MAAISLAGHNYHDAYQSFSTETIDIPSSKMENAKKL